MRTLFLSIWLSVSVFAQELSWTGENKNIGAIKDNYGSQLEVDYTNLNKEVGVLFKLSEPDRLATMIPVTFAKMGDVTDILEHIEVIQQLDKRGLKPKENELIVKSIGDLSVGIFTYNNHLMFRFTLGQPYQKHLYLQAKELDSFRELLNDVTKEIAQ